MPHDRHHCFPVKPHLFRRVDLVGFTQIREQPLQGFQLLLRRLLHVEIPEQGDADSSGVIAVGMSGYDEFAAGFSFVDLSVFIYQVVIPDIPPTAVCCVIGIERAHPLYARARIVLHFHGGMVHYQQIDRSRVRVWPAQRLAVLGFGGAACCFKFIRVIKLRIFAVLHALRRLAAPAIRRNFRCA